jgi:hypothetical protein
MSLPDSCVVAGRDAPAAPAHEWRRPGAFANALAVALVAALWAGYNAWREDRHRVVPLDIDSWGHVIPLLESDHRLANLLQAPSLWKGPVVPTVFGLVYYLAPFRESVLVFNALAFAAAAGINVYAFRRLGANAWCVTLAALFAVFFLPHHFIFGYYYAEPFLALLLSVLLLLTAFTLLKRSPRLALAAGALSGFLLLARAPYLGVVATLPVLMWLHLGEQRKRGVLLFGLGLLATVSPWAVRNYLVYREFIPFTVEAGKVLYLSTYLPADDSPTMETFYQLPEYWEIENTQRGRSEVEQYHFYRQLAVEQVRRDPAAQLRLCAKRALRFWTHVPAYSWRPSWKTAAFAATFLPLAALAVLRRRRWLLVQISAFWVCGLWLVHTFTHGDVRYNFPVLPLLTLLAMIGADELLGVVRRRLALPGPSPALAPPPVR